MANEFIARKGLISLQDSQFTGSINISQNLTVGGTIDASFNSSTGTAISGAFTQDSSSLASRVADLESFDANLDNTYATDAQVSTAVSALNAATSSYLQNTTDTLTGDLTVTGTITAQEFHTEFVSASIIYQSGSTQFGDSADDTHVFTGNVGIGTTSPISKLQVKDSQDSSFDSGIGVIRSASSQTGYINMVGGAFNFNAPSGIPIKFRDGGTVNVTIDSSGNVGIGTASPSQLFHIQSTSGAAGSAVARLSVSGTSGLEVGQEFFSTATDSTSANRSGRIYSKFDGVSFADSRLSFQSMTNGDVLVDTMHLKNGYVGIGTTSPNRLLSLYATSTPIIQLIDSATGTTSNDGLLIQQVGVNTYIENAEVGFMELRTSALPRIRIDSGGNVGIGTTLPTEKLHITGNVAQVDGSPEYHFGTTSASHYNWRIAVQEVVDAGFEIASGTQSAGTGAASDTYTTRFTIKGNTGHVGIGTVSPDYRLKVFGDGTSSGNKLYIQSQNTGVATDKATAFASSSLVIKPHASSSPHMDFFAAGSAGGIGMQVTNYNYTSNWPVFFNPFGGSVGIGTSEPTSILHVISGGTNISAKFESTDGTSGIQLADSTGNVELTTSSTNGFDVRPAGGSPVFRVHGDGNVGIGVTSPATTLHIADTSTSDTYMRFSAASNTATYSYIKHTDTTFNTAKLTFGSAYGYNTPVDAFSIFNGAVTMERDLTLGNRNANQGTTQLFMRNFDSTLVDAGDIQNSIIMTGRYWSGNTSQLIESRINSVHQLSDGNGGSALTFMTQTGGSGPVEQMRIDRDGLVGINTTSPRALLDVHGGKMIHEQDGALVERYSGAALNAVQNTWYDVYTFNIYELTCFFLLVGFENNSGDSLNRTAIFVDSGGSSYGTAFAPTRLTGSTNIEAQRSTDTLQVRVTHSGGSGAHLRWTLIRIDGD